MFDDLDHLIHSDPFATSALHPILNLNEGERREVCILFADCHGFTALSERLDHEVLHNLLDKLMQLFTSRIKHFGGLIDKYEGDLVMALFGAKKASEQDTERAVEAGLQMLAVLEQFNKAISKRLGSEVDIAVRIGVNTGEVTTGRVGEKREGDFTVYGDAVNVASRMESNAPLNRIMMPESTMKRVVHAFDFEPRGSIMVKGKAEPIDTWLVKGSKDSRPNRWQLRWTEFVGRDFELSQLIDKYKEVRENLNTGNSPATLLLTKPLVVGLKGDAGMGKSRLVDEFLKQNSATSFHLHGTTPRLVQQAYGLFISMIRKQLEISQLDDQATSRNKLEFGLNCLCEYSTSEESRERLIASIPMIGYLLNIPFDDVRSTLPPKDLQPHLQTAIRHFIEASATKANRAGNPLLVVMEDLHWTDEPSLTTLEFLFSTLNLEAKRCGAMRNQILFLLTYRPEYSPSRSILEDCKYTEIELAALTPELGRALVKSVAGKFMIQEETLALVMERSSGNPFFIEEWASYISDSGSSTTSTLPVPATLQALILARMDQLEAELKLLLQKAAVLGQEFYVDVIEAMEQRLDGQCDLRGKFNVLENNRFLLPLSGKTYSSYMFKHILTQEVAYGTLLIANRKVLHRIAGEVIEELFFDRLEDYWCELAEHYLKAESWIKAEDYLSKAASQAKKRFDNNVALKYYTALFKVMEEHSEVSTGASVIRARFDLGSLLELTGNWNAARQEYIKSLKLAESLSDQGLYFEAQDRLGSISQSMGNYGEALHHFNIMLTIAEDSGNKKWKADAWSNIGNVARFQGDYDRAFDCYQHAISLAEELGDKRTILIAGANLGILHEWRKENDRALEPYLKLLEHLDQTSEKRQYALMLSNVGGNYLERGLYKDALEMFGRSLTIAEELGDKRRISHILNGCGGVYYELGDFNSALDYFQRSLSISELLGHKRRIAHCIASIALIFLERGELKQAEEYLNRSVKLSRELAQKPFLADFLFGEAVVYFEQKQLSYARAKIDESKVLAIELKDEDLITKLNILSGKIDFASGDTMLQHLAVEGLELLLTQTTSEKRLADIHYELTSMHRALNQSDQAEHHRQEALRLYDDLYCKIPKFKFKKRLNELSGMLMS